MKSSDTSWADVVDGFVLGAIAVLSGVGGFFVGIYALLDWGIVGIGPAVLSFAIGVACIISGLAVWDDVRS